MNIKLSQYTPRKPKEVLITPEVSIFLKLTLEKTCLEVDVIHVMKYDTLQKIVLKDKIRKRETREDIMLMLQRMKNHTRRELDMKVKILQVMNNMS